MRGGRYRHYSQGYNDKYFYFGGGQVVGRRTTMSSMKSTLRKRRKPQSSRPTSYRRELEKRLKHLLEAKISLEPDIKAGFYRRIIE
jgi:hypothetical protein